MEKILVKIKCYNEKITIKQIIADFNKYLIHFEIFKPNLGNINRNIKDKILNILYK